MRRILLLIAVFILAGIPSLYGQMTIAYGAKAGVSLANQSYRFTPIDYTMDTEPVLGPAFTLFLETFRSKSISFQLDLSYACKGSRTKVQGISVNHLEQDRITVLEGELSTSRFRYLSLTPAARYRIGRGTLVPYFLLGPRMDLLLKYSSDSDYPLEQQSAFVFGLSCGAGFEFSLQQVGLFTELQYQPDLSPVTSEDPLLINNNLLSLTLGVRWIVSD